MAELKIKFHYEHGSADEGRLDLYDASVSLQGIARATTIITHAFVNGEIRTRGDAAHGARFYITAPKRGSVIFEAAIWVGGTIAAGLFYDFIKYATSEAVGKFNATDDYNKALRERIEPTIGELPAALESPLDDVHRPIRKDQEMTLTVARPRGGKIITFDSDTALHLLPRTVEPPHPIIGNVTKYNSLTGWGRFFDRTEGRPVSFNIDKDMSDRERSLITWSLHENNMGREGTLYLRAEALVTPTEHIKRYNVSAISDRPI